ncbi:MAG TPA: 4-hydroxyphenylpyruvate dioxygenase [Candidatus Dormibacteraeota bacterium]|nr:4-hydroxyphenylpyruvate dioxygenase [Candidatus Dormibacteraeota bacterium]
MTGGAEALPRAPEYRETSLEGVDHIEFLVGNARQAAHFYRSAFGFDVVAYQGPETGSRDRASYVLKQGQVTLVMTAPLGPDGEIADHVRRHGDGVRTLAFTVDDASAAFHDAVGRGARAIAEPHVLEDKMGAVRLATVGTFGDTVHTFVERAEYGGRFLPGFREEFKAGSGAGLQLVDHCVCNVELTRMDEWVSWYNRVFGFDVFQEFDEADIATKYSALRSKVVRGGRGGSVTFPINEPAQGLRRSQIDEYLDYYHGPGVQHIALHSQDIVESVAWLRRQGAEFLRAPDSYYQALPGRIGEIDEDLGRLQELNILVDRDEHGYLLQIFTRPVEDRPTLFFEVIQRKGCRGFGKGNFQALFQAIEREQEARGNL